MSTPKERGILFSGAMVRALLSGKKTQTRRAVKPQPPEGVGRITVETYQPTVVDRHGEEEPGPAIFGAYDEDVEWGARCPYGAPGDHLWVRETWQQVYASVDPGTNIVDGVKAFRKPDPRQPAALAYVADEGWDAADSVEERGFPWRPSLLMPRWASRLTLAVESIRVERAQAISDADVEAEGVDAEAVADLWRAATAKRRRDVEHLTGESSVDMPPHDRWEMAWTLINGRASWDANPWVWVVSFRVLP